MVTDAELRRRVVEIVAEHGEMNPSVLPNEYQQRHPDSDHSLSVLVKDHGYRNLSAFLAKIAWALRPT